MTRRRYRYSGRVQGVGFRAFVQSVAQRLGVYGWVRNEPDGTVTAEAEGSHEQLVLFLTETRRAHSWARVERVDEMELSTEHTRNTRFDIVG